MSLCLVKGILGYLFYSVCLVVRAYRKENDCSIRQVFTKAKLTALDIAALFTDHKNNAKFSIYPDAAASS
ncbi:hypothetical protein [Desulfobacula sp.]|uniref:hypothetical protein n=1 Tax=Desulfobacula sp. TaxID=2593537 RepID=UPI0025C4596F|nr:hypothetical protein [Desulfobacula sp.]MBC2703942.1 hypothetical protein [Desulfobacula sp.]